MSGKAVVDVYVLGNAALANSVPDGVVEKPDAIVEPDLVETREELAGIRGTPHWEPARIAHY
jgi:hypothetical protein